MTGAQESLPHISRDNDLSANECMSFLSRHSALNKKYVTRVCESIEELLQKRCRYYMWNHMNLSILYVLSWAKWAVWFSACFTRTYLERRMMCGSACTDKFHIQTTRSCFTGQLIRTLCFLLPLPSFSSHSIFLPPPPSSPLSLCSECPWYLCTATLRNTVRLFWTLSSHSATFTSLLHDLNHACDVIAVSHDLHTWSRDLLHHKHSYNESPSSQCVYVYLLHFLIPWWLNCLCGLIRNRSLFRFLTVCLWRVNQEFLLCLTTLLGDGVGSVRLTILAFWVKLQKSWLISRVVRPTTVCTYRADPYLVNTLA